MAPIERVESEGTPPGTPPALITKEEENRLLPSFLFSLRWCVRIAVVGFASYYALGYAYKVGLMMRIDKIMIDFLYPRVGYAGIGAVMPTCQYWASWSVRGVAGLTAGVLYVTSEKVAFYAGRSLKKCYCH